MGRSGPETTLPLALQRNKKTLSWTFLRKHEQSNSYLKPTEEQNPRLTTGLSPVYQWFITGTKSALRSWLLTSVPTPICLCKPFSCKACPGISFKNGFLAVAGCKPLPQWHGSTKCSLGKNTMKDCIAATKFGYWSTNKTAYQLHIKCFESSSL